MIRFTFFLCHIILQAQPYKAGLKNLLAILFSLTLFIPNRLPMGKSSLTIAQILGYGIYLIQKYLCRRHNSRKYEKTSNGFLLNEQDKCFDGSSFPALTQMLSISCFYDGFWTVRHEEKKEVVGAAGFEPATSCSQGRRANQAALRPDTMKKNSLFHHNLRLFTSRKHRNLNMLHALGEAKCDTI